MRDHSVSEVTVVPNPPGLFSGGTSGILHVFCKLWQQLQLWNVSQNLDRILLHNWPACCWHVFDWRHSRRAGSPLGSQIQTIADAGNGFPVDFGWWILRRWAPDQGQDSGRFCESPQLGSKRRGLWTGWDDGFLRRWLFGLSVLGFTSDSRHYAHRNMGGWQHRCLDCIELSEWKSVSHTRSQWIGRKTGLGSARSISKHWVMTDPGCSGSWQQCVAHPSEGGWLKCRMGLEARWQAREASGSILEQASWPFKAQNVKIAGLGGCCKKQPCGFGAFGAWTLTLILYLGHSSNVSPRNASAGDGKWAAQTATCCTLRCNESMRVMKPW